MTEVTPQPLKTQGFHHFFILLFYDHPAKAGRRLFMFSDQGVQPPIGLTISTTVAPAGGSVAGLLLVAA